MRITFFAGGINMAARHILILLKPQLPLTYTSSGIQGRFLSTSPALLKVQAGKIKPTPNKSRAVSYEEALAPPHIGHRKSWNSWNTSSINGGRRVAEVVIEDLFIRKFIQGTFPESVLSKIIIKRQYNIIRIAAIMKPIKPPSRMCFLISYTEELLSHWLHCIVKLEIQILEDPKLLIFKYV